MAIRDKRRYGKMNKQKLQYILAVAMPIACAVVAHGFRFILGCFSGGSPE